MQITIIICVTIVVIAYLLKDWNTNKCKHKWETIKEVTVQSDDGARYSRYHLRCTKCGALLNKDMR